MNQTETLLREIKTMVKGIGLILVSVALLAFGYVFFQNTVGIAIVFYGGILLLFIGICLLLDGWKNRPADSVPSDRSPSTACTSRETFPSSAENNQKEE